LNDANSSLGNANYALGIDANRNLYIGANGTPTVTPQIFLRNNGNFGVGISNPNSKLHVSNGNVYIENINSGVIMKSPNGQCWRMTVSNTGQPVFTAITCP
jgi:hypothetical protein